MLNLHLHVSNCLYVYLAFCRLIYFGGYGQKLLRDINSRNRSFIVDEASWVMFIIVCKSITVCVEEIYFSVIFTLN